ncbi:MAG: YdbL family protein [Idiomarina sp.]|nr:YdbL family protein [Idiomarina sp.]
MLSPARLLFLCSLFFASFAITGTAHANEMSLQQAMSELSGAKAQGQVGEKSNGYLGVVNDAAQAHMIVNLINDARRSEYARIAEQNNIAVADVEAMAGKRAIERTPAGQYIQLDGEWVVKR